MVNIINEEDERENTLPRIPHQPPQQAFAHHPPPFEVTRTPWNCYSCMMIGIGSFFGCLGSIPCWCCCTPYKKIDQGNVGLVEEFGRFTRISDPGLVYVNPVTEALRQVNIKIRVQALPQQVIFTRDNVSVKVDSVLYWRIADAPTAVYRVSDVEKALTERAQTTMREICSVRDLQDMLSHRDQMADEIKHIIEATAQSWGIEIESILIKDIIMGAELQENLSAAAVAKRQGASKVISAQAEVEAARLMREASDIMATPAAMQFRYLDTLQKMATHAQSRVIFMPTSPSGLPQFDDSIKASLIEKI
eukprot:TRINITY_DN733_c0_g1_i2.p1 TRINITY_DN733_c0_g1~~TRINITY_DN733_c0_g1_i2.p1  ORF type:complete len:306 (+),score=57.12 TRINITY_DN733_c0_g1_i2:1022-1939(+)